MFLIKNLISSIWVQRRASPGCVLTPAKLLSCEPSPRGDSCSIVCSFPSPSLLSQHPSSGSLQEGMLPGCSGTQSGRCKCFSVKASYCYTGGKRSDILEGKSEPFTHYSYRHQHLDFLTAKADVCSPCWHYAFKEGRRETQPQTHMF